MSSPMDYWGKFDKQSKLVHPAVFHMLDAGNVALLWMESGALRYQVKALADFLKIDAKNAVSMIAFMCAAHDIGKISPGFQNKVPHLTETLKRIHHFHADPETDHGKIGHAALTGYYQSLDCYEKLACSLAAVSSAHHGQFFSPSKKYTARENVSWCHVRSEVLQMLADHFSFCGCLPANSNEKAPSSLIVELSGFVSVCDWIASAERFFPYMPEPWPSFEDYAPSSMEHARTAIAAVDIAPTHLADGPDDYRKLFGIDTPYPMQAAVAGCMKGTNRPELVLIEAPMGGGKTEAAIHASFSWLGNDGLSGLYMALPTQATSNQMFSRMKRALEKRYRESDGVEVHLLHGLSDMNADYKELLAVNVDDHDATLKANEWFSARKRSLLASFGVGTIDQCLLAAMKTRHVAVRLFALANKVVIFDEVHAYDTYMSELLENLLKWLKAVGARVVLLSATLPSQKRQKLLEAFGARSASDGEAEQAYPLLSCVYDNGDISVMAIPPGEPKSVLLEKLSYTPEDWSLTAVTINERLSSDACAALICNTVANAQAAYVALKNILSADCELFLFHARFPLGQRVEIENRCLELFGKGAKKRPSKAVLVATQVVEQSLDLDFDWMISEPAPLDLILQRMGRLHRHERERSTEFTSPVFSWLEPPKDKDGLPEFGISAYVYDEAILLRSWALLHEKTELNLPGDIRPLVETTYNDSKLLNDGAFEERLTRAKTKRIEQEGKEIQEAYQQILPEHPEKGLDLTLDDDEGHGTQKAFHALTRMAEPSVTLVCLVRRSDGKLLLADGSEYDPSCRTLSPELLRLLRKSSVNIQQKSWVMHILSAKASAAWNTPAAWKLNHHLRLCRPAIFYGERLIDEYSRPAKCDMHLSASLGLVLIKEGE